MTVVHMGNAAPMEGFEEEGDDGQTHVVFRPTSGERITEIHLADDLDIISQVNTVGTLMPSHLQAGQSPAWFETSDSTLQSLLNDKYGLKQKARPEGFGEETQAAKRLAVPMGPVSAFMSTALLIPAAFGIWAATKMSLRTNAGRDFQSGVMFSTASNGTSGFAPACYIALTADTTTPLVTDTSLAGEIVSGTLIRAQGTYAHTTGTSSATLTRLYTSDQVIVIAKIGVFNNVTAGSGTMVLSTLLATVASMASGDQLNVNEGITL